MFVGRDAMNPIKTDLNGGNGGLFQPTNQNQTQTQTPQYHHFSFLISHTPHDQIKKIIIITKHPIWYILKVNFVRKC